MTARWLVIALTGCLAATAPVPATSMELHVAETANREGEQYLAVANHAFAIVKFREAIARAPQAHYFVNLCLALKLDGQLHDAMVACDGAFERNPPFAVGDYAIKLMREIEAEGHERGIALPHWIDVHKRVANRPDPAPNHAPDDGDELVDDPPRDPTETSPPPVDARLAPIGSRPRKADGSQAVLAARVNFDGTEMMRTKRYPQASAKFREAVARVPEPAYFFNLCLSLYYEGKFAEAMTSCSAVMRNSPNASLESKARQLTTRVIAEAERQQIRLAPRP